MTDASVKFVLLWSDAVMWLLALALGAYIWHAARREPLRESWARVARDAPALCSAVVLAVFTVLALADSIHFRRALPAAVGQGGAYSTHTESLLDVAVLSRVAGREESYSAPLATRGLTPVSQPGDDGRARRVHPRLLHGGRHLQDDLTERDADVWRRLASGLGLGAAVAVALGLFGAMGAAFAQRRRSAGREPRAVLFAEPRLSAWLMHALRGQTALPWRAFALTVLVLCLAGGVLAALAPHYHVFGTDRTGNDVLVQAIKSIRTAFVIGALATLATLPLAVALGLLAGYFKGWVDELIQYLYTVLSSVPNVLLIAACVLMMQVFIDTHPDWFETGTERSDARLVLLCVVLGLTGWATLCRLLRAETMKLRELEHVQAAVAFGVGHLGIMRRHILPNVMHLIVITTVLDFSALVLYEAVLSYVGVGVDPAMNSFGGMINLARSEMSRDPLVWWSFAAAFVFMVMLVLAANLFADGVRDAFDPRARVFRTRRPGLRRLGLASKGRP